MKLGLAIAPAQALPSAFVVFRDHLNVSMSKATCLGYDGVELALASAEEVDVESIGSLLDKHDLELAAISTGRVRAERQVYFTHPDPAVRQQAVSTVQHLTEVAAEFGAVVNIGRIRGNLNEKPNASTCVDRFLGAMVACAEHAKAHNVKIVLEPVNRYETDFINSVLNSDNVFVMPDTFHMNIEEASITGSLCQAQGHIGYVHVADSNRWSPGQGHLPFPDILRVLKLVGYGGYVTVEILPHPDPDTAAHRAAAYLTPLLAALNGEVSREC